MSSTEVGVSVINGTDPDGSRSRSASPISRKNSTKEEEKPKRFLNGWSKEQERLMAEWSDIALCYRWLHDQSEKVFHTKTLWINLPVIVLSTLGGTANFGVQSLFAGDDTALKYSSFAIGGISLLAGLMTTVGNYLRYAQLEESHRVASISWGKFQRLVAVELALNPNDRMDSLDFLKICRAELDRLIEQSPPLPKNAISLFESKFGKIKDLKKPDICGELAHTYVYQSSETRLKQMAADAALMLRRKRQTLNELVSPEVEKQISRQVEGRIEEAIESRKRQIEEEIEFRKAEERRLEEERVQVLEARRKRIEEEIEAERKKIAELIPPTPVPSTTTPKEETDESITPKLSAGASQFESRMSYRRASLNISRPTSRKRGRPPSSSPTPKSMARLSNTIIEPDLEATPEDLKGLDRSTDTIIIVSRPPPSS
jgi:hypothetical protein